MLHHQSWDNSIKEEISRQWLLIQSVNYIGYKKLNTKQDNLKNFAEDSTESGNFDQLREPLLEELPKPTHSVV